VDTSGSYSFLDEKEKEISSGKADIRFNDLSISIRPEFGETLAFSFRDVASVESAEYRVKLCLATNETVILSELGYTYEDFIRLFNKSRNALIIKDMLMSESLKYPGVQSDYECFSESGTSLQKGACEVILYDTALVVVPEKTELVRIPYAEIAGLSAGDYTFTVKSEFDGTLVFSKMGRQTDPFNGKFSDILNEISEKTQAVLKSIAPDAGPSVVQKAAGFLKDGKAARKSDIESASPELWKKFEEKIEKTELKEEYAFLKSIARQEKICIGMKRELVGKLGGGEGEYIWCLIPVYGIGGKTGGNAIAMESITTTAEGKGKATYFFKIAPRRDLDRFKTEAAMDTQTDMALTAINRCMLAINFRRQPVFLSEAKLNEPQYERYKFSIQKIPGLRVLRSGFIGRVVHANDAQWQDDVRNLLKFNVSSKDDDARWIKGELEDSEIEKDDS
jgi:hypothetical protein